MPLTLLHHIESLSAELGFDAWGVARAEQVANDAARRYRSWVDSGENGCMQWAANHSELRNDPTLLMPGAKSVLVFAANYFPARMRKPELPRFAYYAYGEDYHKVLRRKLKVITRLITQTTGHLCRICVDSAPIHERYWARMAGLGFIGLNNALIIPGKGSYFFLGIILTSLELPASEPCRLSCGECRLCIRSCPAGALTEGKPVDARRCLSCLTIEHSGPLPRWTSQVIGNRAYGCDTCQQCCPHNRHAKPTRIAEFEPSPEFLNLTDAQILAMTDHDFQRIFGRSAVRRAGLERLQRNLLITRKP